MKVLRMKNHSLYLQEFLYMHTNIHMYVYSMYVSAVFALHMHTKLHMDANNSVSQTVISIKQWDKNMLWKSFSRTGEVFSKMVASS